MSSEQQIVTDDAASAAMRAAPRRTRFLLLLPRLIFCVGVAIVIAGSIRYVAYSEGGAKWEALALLLIYLCWLIAEASVTFRQAAVVPADSKTLLPYALARLSVLAGAAFAPLPWSSWRVWMLAPAALFVAGVLVRQIAIRSLGRFYSHHVMRQQDHAIVTSGLYRIIRHPAYAGMLAAHIGFVVFFSNPYSMIALLLLVAAVLWRIRVEERALWTVPGYPSYANGRARLLPRLW